VGNLSKTFDWKKSSAHANFLIRYFIGPNDGSALDLEFTPRSQIHTD